MFELDEWTHNLKILSDKIERIRKLSKGLSTDYRHYPYDNDFRLIAFLLDEKIEELEKE